MIVCLYRYEASLSQLYKFYNTCLEYLSLKMIHNMLDSVDTEATEL